MVIPLLLSAALLLMGAGCTTPVQDDQRASAAAPAAPAPGDTPPPVRDTRTTPQPAPPMNDPLPPVRAPEREDQLSPRTPAPVTPAGTAVKINTSCTRDADCAVKNVGNCCGYYPACVNVNSPTDPAGVQAQCARTGEMSVCGFPSISACQCVAGQCQSGTGAVTQ